MRKSNKTEDPTQPNSHVTKNFPNARGGPARKPQRSPKLQDKWRRVLSFKVPPKMSLTTAYRSCATEQRVITSRKPTNPANGPRPIFEWTRQAAPFYHSHHPSHEMPNPTKQNRRVGDTAHVGKNPGFPKGKARRVRKRGDHLRKNLGFPKATQGELAKGANKTEASWQQEGPTK
jgi:hypothetical protein